MNRLARRPLRRRAVASLNPGLAPVAGEQNPNIVTDLEWHIVRLHDHDDVVLVEFDGDFQPRLAR